MLRNFNNFVHRYIFKDKKTSKIKIQQVLSSLNLNDINFIVRDGPFSSDIGIVKLHPSKRSHRMCYINENYFDSYGCVCPEKLSKFNMKQYRHCLYSEYKIQGLSSKRDSYRAKYCLYKNYLKKRIGMNFKSAVLNVYCQMIHYCSFFL